MITVIKLYGKYFFILLVWGTLSYFIFVGLNLKEKIKENIKKQNVLISTENKINNLMRDEQYCLNELKKSELWGNYFTLDKALHKLNYALDSKVDEKSNKNGIYHGHLVYQIKEENIITPILLNFNDDRIVSCSSDLEGFVRKNTMTSKKGGVIGEKEILIPIFGKKTSDLDYFLETFSTRKERVGFIPISKVLL